MGITLIKYSVARIREVICYISKEKKEALIERRVAEWFSTE